MINDCAGKKLSDKILVNLFASARARKRWIKENILTKDDHSFATPVGFSVDESDQLLELPGGLYFGKLN